MTEREQVANDVVTLALETLKVSDREAGSLAANVRLLKGAATLLTDRAKELGIEASAPARDTRTGATVSNGNGLSGDIQNDADVPSTSREEVEKIAVLRRENEELVARYETAQQEVKSLHDQLRDATQKSKESEEQAQQIQAELRALANDRAAVDEMLKKVTQREVRAAEIRQTLLTAAARLPTDVAQQMIELLKKPSTTET